MKNSKGETLPQPYFDLAMMRREQQGGKGDDINELSCFDWAKTHENEWWLWVWEGETPKIPDASLAELEAWRKSRDGNNQEAMVADNPEPDYKAMYDELCKRYKALDHNHNRPCQDYDFYKHRTNVIADPTTSRNWIAECAMAAMQGLSQGTHMPPNQEMIEYAWTLAEAWAAEGKKRGRIS